MGVASLLRAWYTGDNGLSSAKQALEDATSYDEYEKAALLLDFLEGRNTYKAEPVSEDYDSSLIFARMTQLREARLDNDFGKVLFLLRTTLSRNLGNMGNANLYAWTHIGTKYLIEEYILEVQNAFSFVLDYAKMSADTDTQEILNSLLKIRQSFGRTALLLSGGGTLGMMHIGVVKVLFEAHLLPRIISGSSAGAIVAAIVCTRKDEEMDELCSNFHRGNLQVFQNETYPENIFSRIGRFLKHGVFMDIKYLRDVMAEWMGDMTFGEAFNKTRRILNITVSSSSIYEMPRLLNYITAPNVIIWSAVAASCSIPGIFAGSPLLAKDSKTGERVKWNAGSNKCIDGSIEGDLPTARLSELFNVNHCIVSQVNPHVTLFLPTQSHELQKASGTLPTMVINEVLHIADVVTTLGLLPALSLRFTSILTQHYIGDITILPRTNPIQGMYKLLTNPTPEFMLTSMSKGEKATWERMSLIKNHLQIETTIDTSLYQLRLALIPKSRPTMTLKSSQSTNNFIPHVPRLRRRSSSIVSNTSVEIDPSDVAPIRMKSGSSTPRFDGRTQTTSRRRQCSTRHSRTGSFDSTVSPTANRQHPSAFINVFASTESLDHSKRTVNAAIERLEQRGYTSPHHATSPTLERFPSIPTGPPFPAL